MNESCSRRQLISLVATDMRLKPKGPKARKRIAQGKRSAALGYSLSGFQPFPCSRANLPYRTSCTR
jgi:hypothetical protein